ncbi:alpha-aminoadipic semialdehyde synthase isoform X3 [Brassica napus]|uniref:alpha-aminoadipic semialdehyde synthase isoform X3 n=1 Tax=Brassica napus TaxID=3708 RepID=UPI000BBEC50C|nr:alpha-aminoadipic semialdehyde synthase isoform X3 [Brassica napus]
MDHSVDVVLRLSSLSFHDDVSKTIIELKKHLITASYVDDETSMLHEMAKNASITVLSETTSHNLAFSMNLSPLNSVRQRKNVLNPKPLIRKLCKEVAHSKMLKYNPA